jgi:ribosomal protein L35AE/L33A
VLGHKRAKRNTRPNTSLIQIEGVATKEDAQFYLGKRVAYVYKAKREIQGSKVRVIWGSVFLLSSTHIPLTTTTTTAASPGHTARPAS